MNERDLHLLHCKKTSKTTYFNIKTFTQHAPPKMSGRDHESLQQSENSAVSNHSQVALGRLQILWKGLQLLPSKRLGEAGNTEAQLLRRQASKGSTRASRPPLLLAGPLSGIKPHASGRHSCIHVSKLTKDYQMFNVIAVYIGGRRED